MQILDLICSEIKHPKVGGSDFHLLYLFYDGPVEGDSAWRKFECQAFVLLWAEDIGYLHKL